MVRISNELLEKIIINYGSFFNNISKLPAEKCAHDVVDEDKVHDQVHLLCSLLGYTPDALKGKMVLEIGSGFGLFVAVTRRDYGWNTIGIEPAGEGFDSSYILAHEVLREYNIPEDAIKNATGENLPFNNESFDFIFSSTVLEHTNNPELVLREAHRVLKPGGGMQFVFPNYASFFEGHYAIPWIPYMGTKLGSLWVRLWNRDPAFIKTLQLLTYRQIKTWMQKFSDVDVITYGKEVFIKRMLSIDIKDWAGLGKIKRLLVIIKKLRILRFVTFLMAAAGSFEPIILTVKKQRPNG
ncbi:MAG: class I SAM-dependent methyltransferase [Fibrobacter sp.]|nr:class I SAM-dependent methyltransferase [Fibrobacter sp.]